MWVTHTHKQRRTPIKNGLKKIRVNGVSFRPVENTCLCTAPWVTAVVSRAQPCLRVERALFARGTGLLFSAFSESDGTKANPTWGPTYYKIIRSTMAEVIAKPDSLGGATPDIVVRVCTKPDGKEYGLKVTQTPFSGNNLGLCL